MFSFCSVLFVCLFVCLSTNNISFNINIQFYEKNRKNTIILVTVQQEHISLFIESEIFIKKYVLLGNFLSLKQIL